jgi:superfamily II DNA/RNA helicase
MKLARRAHILVATPGRLEDILQRRAVSLEHVRILVLDEADRMLDMGFRPPVDRIVARTPRSRQTLFFSATLEGAAGAIASAYTKSDARRHDHVPAVDRTVETEHRFMRVAHEAKVDTLVRELRDEERGRTIVFVRTKRGADRLVKRLRDRDVTALAMHGDKSQAQREKALARFERGDVDTLVATDVAARGIDVRDVTHVINYDAPEDRDGYVHRIGRTGRAGRAGIGVTFVLGDQARDMSRIASDLGLHREFSLSGMMTSAGANGSGTPRRRSQNGQRPGRRERAAASAQGGRSR